MQEQLISPETAKLAEEKGFPQDNFNLTKQQIMFVGPRIVTQSLLQTWLRNVKGIEITIIPNYIYIVFPLKRMTDALDKLEKDQTIDLLDLASEIEYKTYEEALEVALQEGLKLLKNKK